ncbi:uncharacterized protein N7498_004301 [Penicillium cinerascens]|uniref:NACHT domain-containing protein n=1 Tax=Penicillium cinerascens TaxID=70096 RepID=A0A9W9N3U6_9EURO|nr:uncharacterized protein N7498_004301 [Penicillium cinerascens]KAJ5212655.1 hypothetical protein N7498_004301 [Penicillium cinerascens]
MIKFETNLKIPHNPLKQDSTVSNFRLATPSSLPLIQTSDVTGESNDTGNNGAMGTPQPNTLEQDVTADQLSLHDSIGNVHASSDIWSAAYREAVDSLGEEITTALSGKTIEQLFKELEETEHEATHESAFLRGVQRLRSLKTPLDNFKLALDLASPLANLEPTATTVFGVVRSVTAIAITFANADLDFAKQIADMLERISYIDECDTLGRKVDRKDIHQALVSVYQKILEFYNAALKILTRKGAKLVLRMVLENGRLPDIIQEFLTNANKLQAVIQKATLDILDDFQNVVYTNEFAQWFGKDKLSRQSELLSEWQGRRANQACQFLLENPNFNNWYNTSESQQLVILGDMGHGKSYAMAFLADKLIQKNKFRLPRPALCQYYCLDKETGKATSVLSALTYSLLNQFQGLRKPFFERYQQAKVSDLDPVSNTATMENFLQNMLETIDRPVIVVIDGIDECDDDSRNRLLRFLRTVSQTTSGIKVILSARPREEILEQLDDMTRIEMGSDPERDRIIVEKTLEILSYLSPELKALVGKKLSERAQGSAIWTRMIIELIKVRHLTTKPAIKKFLEEMSLPEKLSEVYVSLLLRCTSDDGENRQLAVTALKILAVSHRPLSILELSWAVALSLADRVTTVEALAELVDHQRVMGFIYPFIALPDYDKLRKPQVRLTHKTVKEWVLTLPDPKVSSLKETDQIVHVSKSLDSFMVDICTKYLLLDDIGNKDLFSEEQAAFAELPQISELSSDDEESLEYDPNCTWESWEDDMARFDPVDRGFGEFFVYASCHWLDHFGCITAEPLPSLASIEKLCQAGSTRLRNWIQQNSRPGCTMMPRFEFDSNLYDPLSITSIYGSVAILIDMLRKSDFGNGKFLQGSAIKAADQILQWGDISRLQILFFDDQLGHQLQNLELFRLIIKTWDKARLITNPWHKGRQNWDLIFDLVDNVSDQMIEQHWGNELLCFAASAGCMPIVQRLMTSAQHKGELRDELLRETKFEETQSSFDKSAHQSIEKAVLGKESR